MNIRFTFILVALLAFAAPICAQSKADEEAKSKPPTFAEQVDLTRFGQVAVHTEGRVKSLDSHARTLIQLVQGAPRPQDPTPAFTYLDMMFRPDAYADADIIFIKNKSVRAQIVQALQASMQAHLDNASPNARASIVNAIEKTRPRLDAFTKTGRISPEMLNDDRVHELLGRLQTDLLRTAKLVDAIETAMSVRDPDRLRANLRLIAPPPPEGTLEDQWLTFDDLNSQQPPTQLVSLDPALRGKLIDQWSAFASAWQEQNAPAVNAAANELASLLPTINPELYPETSRLAWESWYFRAHNMTWVWLIYAFTLVPLLLAVVFKWPAARIIGLLMFFTAFGFHTFAVMLRWYVADRWPNSNMFEAVTTAAWFGGCFALLLELVVRRLPMRNLFALGSATASMCALMAVHFLPLQLNPSISNMMPVLNDVWLYIHTNVIILSYCLIFIAAVTAIIYLAYRFIALLAAWPRAMEYARVGGAGSLILTRPDGSSYFDERGGRSTLGQVLDGTTMVMMELSFILLWTGLVIGAIWADHSWGRPWGWDPKEVFALNTFIIFLILVHVRLKVKDKGLWTAILAVIGAGVMLFNWVIINFAISGLHSYA